MRIRACSLLCFLLANVSLYGQTVVTVEKTEISGISEDKLSAALRSDLQKLAGHPYDEKAAGQIAERIQAELPEYVATSTTAPGTQPDRVRLVFAVAHNINAKYIVESVELKDIDKSKLTDSLWSEMQKMVGHPVDDAEADRLRHLIAAELKMTHIKRSVERGNEPEHVRIVYAALSENSFSGTFTNAGYHSRQKFSGTISASYTRLNFTGIRFDAMNDANHLTERFAGFQYGYWLEYKRIRFNTNYSSLRAQWNSSTLLAASRSTASGPELYRLRDTIEPTVKVTISPIFHATFGIASTQLQMQSPVLHFESVRAATGNLEYSVPLAPFQPHQLYGSYDIHVAGNTLNSAASYTRHLSDLIYEYNRHPKPHPSFIEMFEQTRVRFNFKLGRITGNAPLFERFSLGNIATLRGWNKYEIAPLGANRMAYGSMEFTLKYGRVFFDSGSLWDIGQPKVFHNSVGGSLMLGNLFHSSPFLRIFLNIISPGIGIPLRGSNAHPIFTIGGGS